MTTYKGWFGRKARRRCPHSNLRGIYGDEINRTWHGWRLRCGDCGRLLDGRVALAQSRQENEVNMPEFRFIRNDDRTGRSGMALFEATRTGHRFWVPRHPINWPPRDGGSS